MPARCQLSENSTNPGTGLALAASGAERSGRGRSDGRGGTCMGANRGGEPAVGLLSVQCQAANQLAACSGTAMAKEALKIWFQLSNHRGGSRPHWSIAAPGLPGPRQWSLHKAGGPGSCVVLVVCVASNPLYQIDRDGDTSSTVQTRGHRNLFLYRKTNVAEYLTVLATSCSHGGGGWNRQQKLPT